MKYSNSEMSKSREGKNKKIQIQDLNKKEK